MVGVGFLSHVFKAEFVTDDRTAGGVAEKVHVACGHQAHERGFALRGGFEFFNAPFKVRDVGPGLIFFTENGGKVHVVRGETCETSLRAVRGHVYHRRDFREFVVLFRKAPRNKDHVGFGFHQSLKVDFLQGADVFHLCALFKVLLEVCQRRHLGQRHNAVGELPMVERIQNRIVRDGNALGICGNRDVNELVFTVKRFHRDGFVRRKSGKGNREGCGGGRREHKSARKRHEIVL